MTEPRHTVPPGTAGGAIRASGSAASASTVTGHDGVRLHVTTAGDPGNPPILLIHGWSQSHQSWAKQLSGALADQYYLVAPDLRGHGASDKPDAPGAYNSSRPWAGDIAAIIAQLKLDKPVLVGWSMGGKVMMDYLRIHGDAALSGVVLVGSAVTSGSYSPPEASKQRGNDAAVAAKGMYSDDLDENLAATLGFLKACTATPLAADDLATMMGFNMLCPPYVRAAARLRDEDYRPDAAATSVPARIIWGAKERIMPRALFDEACAAFAKPVTQIFEYCGHAPFWEAPEAFDAALADFTTGLLRDSYKTPTGLRQAK